MKKTLLKSIESNITLESRKYFYSQIEKRSDQYLQDMLGEETFLSLKKSELTNTEIEIINSDLLSIITSGYDQDRPSLKNSIKTSLESSLLIIIRPELSICTEIVLEYLLSQRIGIQSIQDHTFTARDLLNLLPQKVKLDEQEAKILPTRFINFLHSPAKLIYLKNPLNSEIMSKVEQSIFAKEYQKISKLLENRSFAILDPLRYIQNIYLGLNTNKHIKTPDSYLQTLIKVLNL
jgi:hypothetical protein